MEFFFFFFEITLEKKNLVKLKMMKNGKILDEIFFCRNREKKEGFFFIAPSKNSTGQSSKPSLVRYVCLRERPSLVPPSRTVHPINLSFPGFVR